jgi:hypothetical protein
MNWRRVLRVVKDLVPIVGLGLLVWFTVVYVADQQRKICGLMVVLDTAYHQTPPTTETGRNIADEVARYRAEIGC